MRLAKDRIDAEDHASPAAFRKEPDHLGLGLRLDRGLPFAAPRRIRIRAAFHLVEAPRPAHDQAAPVGAHQLVVPRRAAGRST
ncbi:hypothetical protein [Limimaricola cinnabarinus]|uniref:hypothetical protein n=1 Tax=Limimaricola cinnabarinus TaxID=1125964 RepID=UPI002FE0B847